MFVYTKLSRHKCSNNFFYYFIYKFEMSRSLSKKFFRIFIFTAAFVIFSYKITSNKNVSKLENGFIPKEINVILESKTTNITNKVTLVTGYFDISRNGRPKEEYFSWIQETFKLNASIICFTESKFADTIKSLAPVDKDILIINLEIYQLPYYKYMESIKRIFSSSYYRKKIAHSDRIECVNPLYSVVIFSKLALLEKAAKLNPFNSDQFIWVDAGISRFFGDFNLSLPFKTKPQLDEAFFTIFEDRALNDKHFIGKDSNDIMWSSKNYFQAGVMGGSYQVIAKVNMGLKEIWDDMQKNNVVNNEQIGLILLYFRQPQLFYLFYRTTLSNMAEIFKYLTS